jgi:hypothetical protein
MPESRKPSQERAEEASVTVTEQAPMGDFLPPTPVRRRRPSVGVAIAVVVALVAAAAGAAVVLRKEGHHYPSAWDPRVADLVSFVERERGLDFDHPVYLDFLAPEDFEKLVRTDESKLTADDRKDIQNTAAFLRALGLIGSDVDLFAAENDLHGGGTLAYYDFTDGRVRVRGTELTPSLRLTLVHELTHALQDQRFDLSRIGTLDASRSEMLHALAEGDANRIESAYRDTLSDRELDQVDQAGAAGAGGLDEGRFPAVLTALFFAPYALGEPLVSIIDETKGQQGLDDAFRDPPAAEEALLDPLGYVGGDTVDSVPEVKLAEGEEKLDGGEFGAFGLYLVLAHRLDEKRAMTVATGWGGDSYLAYRANGRVCVRATFVGDDPAATAALLAALGDWALAMPAGTVTVQGVDGRVEMGSCEPPGTVAVPDGVTVDRLIGLPATRAGVVLGVLRPGADVRFARCFSDGYIGAFSTDDILAADVDAAASARIQAIAAGCRRT